MPILPDEDVHIRTNLRRRYFQRFQSGGAPDLAEQGPDPNHADPTEEYTQRLSSTKHPLLALVDTEGTPSIPATRSLQEVERTLRERMGAANRYIDDSAATTFNQLDQSSPPVASEARKGLSHADQQARAVIGVLAEPTWERDPCSQLRDFDRHAFLLWQGQRNLFSWWGAGDKVSNAYFLAAARHQLNRAASSYMRAKSYRAALSDVPRAAIKA